jgi:DNA-directed RNA polymerase subunit RPC12/RpoP
LNTLVEYKCPCCSGAISFDSEAQKLVCPYCQTEFEVSAVKEFNDAENDKGEKEELNWDEYTSESGNGDWREGEELNVYTCSACAGEIVADATTAATFCPYCGSPVIIAGKLSGAFRPDYVIPFKVNREEAQRAFEKFMKKRPLLPKDFRFKHTVEKIEGIYVPFWLYNCDTDSYIRYRATRVRRWSDSNYIYTKTSHYLLTRAGTLGFERVPADGSSKMDDRYMEAIEPYNYSEMIDFTMPYLSGFAAEKYDVSPSEASEHANQRIKTSTASKFASTTGGYTTVNTQSSNIKLINGKTSYALLPVWMLNTKYNDKTYTFAMNGQTGKFVGELPVSIGRCFGMLGIITGAATLLGTIISLLATLL